MQSFLHLSTTWKQASDFYKKAQASIWSVEEMNLAEDRVQWESFSSEQKRAMFHVLAFFASADSIVQENLMEWFACDIQVPEFRLFHIFQAMIENMHWEVYSLLIEAFIQDPKEQSTLFYVTSWNKTVPTWLIRYIWDTVCRMTEN